MNTAEEYKSILEDYVEDLNDLLADLEDIRDEMQDQIEEKDDPSLRSLIQRADAAIAHLSAAADALDGDA